jgi:hypothetical protein
MVVLVGVGFLGCNSVSPSLALKTEAVSFSEVLVSLPTNPRGATTQMTNVYIFTAVRISNLISVFGYCKSQ